MSSQVKCSLHSSIAHHLPVYFVIVESIRDSLNEVVTPHKPKSRPPTTSSVARRMVGHALGLKINVSPEQNRLEKQKIENAKGSLT